MAPEDCWNDEQYCLGQAIDEIHSLKAQLAKLTAERDEAVALLREIHEADIEAIQAIRLLGGEIEEPFYADKLAAIINSPEGREGE